MSELYDDYEDWEDSQKDSPLALVGIVVMALTAVAIMANALFFQPKSAELALIAEAEKAKKALAQQSQTQNHVQNKTGTARNEAHFNRVFAVQRQLTMAGYYVGPLDGKEGSQTREAIRAYEDAVGLPSTGRVTQDLFEVLTGRKTLAQFGSNQVRSEKVAMKDQYTASIAPVITALPKPKPSRISSKAPSHKRPAQQTITGPVPPKEIPSQASTKADPTLAQVQDALMRLGYGKLTIDGKMGTQTSSAISQFQRNRGHPVTGNVNDKLLKDLMMMGMLNLG